MKNITKVVVLALVMIVFHVNTYAQKSEQQRMTVNNWPRHRLSL